MQRDDCHVIYRAREWRCLGPFGGVKLSGDGGEVPCWGQSRLQTPGAGPGEQSWSGDRRPVSQIPQKTEEVLKFLSSVCIDVGIMKIICFFVLFCTSQIFHSKHSFTARKNHHQVFCEVL